MGSRRRFVPSKNYYEQQAELCMKMALVANTRKERTRLVILANDYMERASLSEAQKAEQLSATRSKRAG
jgi:hypothetical protein